MLLGAIVWVLLPSFGSLRRRRTRRARGGGVAHNKAMDPRPHPFAR